MLPIGDLPVDSLRQPFPGLSHGHTGELGPRHRHMAAAADRLHHQLHIEPAQRPGGYVNAAVIVKKGKGGVHPLDIQQFVRSLGGGDARFRRALFTTTGDSRFAV